MIYIFDDSDLSVAQAKADAIMETKHVWWDILRIVVYTGADIPVLPCLLTNSLP